MKAGAEYLVRVTKPSGEFVYLDSLREDKTYKPVYNVVRHGGTLYAMADYYSHFPDPAMRSALVRSANFLKQKYMKPIPGQKDTLAIWELPSDRDGAKTEVKLGGVALGLVGLVGAEEAAPGTTSLKTLRQLGNGILFLQEKDGSFYSKFDPAKGGKQDKWDSLYYPGEAALALAMLGEIEPNKKLKRQWINAAFRAINYLAQLRKDSDDVPPDHWVLIATARLWPLYELSDKSVSKDILVKHAAQIAFVLAQDGALQDVRTTPIATRLEGLQAALIVLPLEQKEIRADIEAKVEKGIDFLLKTQVRDGELKGAIPRAYTAPGEKKVEARADEVRIDYVQHALSAWLEYSRQHGIIKTKTIKTP